MREIIQGRADALEDVFDQHHIKILSDPVGASQSKCRSSIASVMIFVDGILLSEAELLSSSGGLSQGIGLKHILEFMVRDRAAIELFTDSSSSRAWTHRSGIGRLKHINTRRLWIQVLAKQGTVSVKPVKTLLNCSDLNEAGAYFF